MSDPNVLQLLGNIDGKLEEIGKSLDRHIDDDVRRFSEVYKTLGEHDKEIAKAQGAKGAIMWIVGLIAGSVGAIASLIIKAKGG